MTDLWVSSKESKARLLAFLRSTDYIDTYDKELSDLAIDDSEWDDGDDEDEFGRKADPAWVIKAMMSTPESVLRGIEAKALDTDPDPSPKASARRLRLYWTRGKGAIKIAWGLPGDFNRCVTHLGKYVKDPKGLCNVYHQSALGAPPGKGH